MQKLDPLPYPASNMPKAAPAPVEGPSYTQGGLDVNQIELKTFTGDQMIPAGFTAVIDVRGQLGANCAGFRLVNVLEPIQININGGGWRTVTGDLDADRLSVFSLMVKTGPAFPVTVQLNGV